MWYVAEAKGATGWVMRRGQESSLILIITVIL